MKSGTHFHFRQFSVQHDRCEMKVGTDGVLLGAWVDLTRAKNVLDIGTGCGLIALMLAQRSAELTIQAVEIDKDAAEQAAENIRRSIWADRINVHNIAVQDYLPQTQFDLIITNPPYFNRSLEPPNKKRNTVRHTSTLSYDQLLFAVVRWLLPNGRFSLILPFTEGILFTELALQYSLFCTRRFQFRTRKEKPIERTLLEFQRESRTIEEGEILLYESGSNWSNAYTDLTSAFYLKK